MPILFTDLAEASARLASTRSRLQKRRILVDLLARVPHDQLAAAVGWLIAEPLCGRLGVGPAHLWGLSATPAADRASVTLREVEDALATSRGAGRDGAAVQVAALFERLTGAERTLLAGALTDSLRQGSLGGVMLLALGELAGRDQSAVRRTVMLAGSIPRAAEALLGADRGLAPLAGMTLFRPLAPMLAASSESLAAALARVAEPLIEWKIDGVRAQVHKRGARVAVYSRQGNDITAGCDAVVRALATLAADETVLDGEVVLVGPDGAPRPFQDSFSAIASKSAPREGDRLRVYLFDCLYCDGVELLET